MTTSLMVSSIAFDWRIVRRSTLREKNSTTREHHRHVIFIMVRWLHVKWHALHSAVSFYAAVCTVRRMIDAARLISFRFYKKHLKTTKDTDMNRIQSLFWEKNINNQSEISCLPRWWRNTAVKANCFDFNVLLSSILDFSPLLLALDSCHLKDWRQINPHRKSQWMLLPPPLRLLLLLLQPATAGMVRVRMKYLPVVQLLLTAMWKMNWIVASQFRWYGINETSAGWSRRDFRPQTHGRSLCVG